MKDITLTKTNYPDGSVRLTLTETLADCVRVRCQFCGADGYKEIQEHGHYRTECCKQITSGCCDGTSE